IPASRILPLALTSRWAMVASGTRKARAISAVVSPPSSRRVSATWTPGSSAGWQQVKIRRSRSSRTAPSSAGSSRAWTRAAWAWRSARDASRRRRSMALLRAVVMIQPAGLGGGPVAGQRCTAAANASWTASSATSMSPKGPARTDTARPYSARNTRSTSAAARAGTPASVLDLALERPHLDGEGGRPGELAGPGEGGVQVGGLDDGEPADVLLALGEGPVGGEDLAAAGPHHRGRARRVQPAGEHPGPGRLELLVHRVQVAVDPLQLLGRESGPVGLVHAEQVLLHRAGPPWVVSGRPSGRWR